jgi:hypothetical protein
MEPNIYLKIKNNDVIVSTIEWDMHTTELVSAGLTPEVLLVCANLLPELRDEA